VIAELGLAALWLCAALAVLQLIGGALAQRGDNAADLAAMVRPAAILQGVLAGFAFVCLLVGVRGHGSIGKAGRDQLAQYEADDLQIVGRLGQSRRVYVIMGDCNGTGWRL